MSRLCTFSTPSIPATSRSASIRSLELSTFPNSVATPFSICRLRLADPDALSMFAAEAEPVARTVAVTRALRIFRFHLDVWLKLFG